MENCEVINAKPVTIKRLNDPTHPIQSFSHSFSHSIIHFFVHLSNFNPFGMLWMIWSRINMIWCHLFISRGGELYQSWYLVLILRSDWFADSESDFQTRQWNWNWNWSWWSWWLLNARAYHWRFIAINRNLLQILENGDYG